jgi:hypothetical protein
MNNFWNAGMPASPLLGKPGPCILDQSTVLKADCNANKSSGTTGTFLDFPAGAVSDPVLGQRLPKANKIARSQWQRSQSAVAINDDRAEIRPANETLFSENLASNEIEGDGIAVPACHDDNVVAMRPSKVLPSLDRERLRGFRSRNQVNPTTLGIGPQAGLRVALGHRDRGSPLPVHSLAPDARQRRPALDNVRNRFKRTSACDRG